MIIRERDALAPVADAARAVTDALYRLDREWDAAEQDAYARDNTGGERAALRAVLLEGFPLKDDLESLIYLFGQWTEHVERVTADRPGEGQQACPAR